MVKKYKHPKPVQVRFTATFVECICRTWPLLSKAEERQEFSIVCTVTIAIFKLIRAISGSGHEAGRGWGWWCKGQTSSTLKTRLVF